MKTPTVKLSAREQAINVLNDAPRHVDTKVCAAFKESDAERDALKARVAELEALLNDCAAVTAEREACAKICADLWTQEPEPGTARDCHDAIRARGAR